jgi:ketosteroid isomerase-like protein
VTLDVARRVHDALEAHDVDAVVELLDPEVIVVTPKGSVLHGPDEVRAYYGGGGFDHLVVATEDHHFVAHDAGVRLHARQVYRWRETGEHAYERPLVVHFELRGDKVSRIEFTLSQEAAA